MFIYEFKNKFINNNLFTLDFNNIIKMPLIMIIGGPCCGKTTLAIKLYKFLLEKELSVHLVNEESLGIKDVNCYENFQTEKNLRAKLKSEVENKLDDNKIVILDYMNYIKGYRYELHCLVKNFKTRQSVIYLKIDLEYCLKNNENDKFYSPDLLKDLYSRMEEPKGKDRWDCPLNQIYLGEELPYDEILKQVSEGHKPKSIISTEPDMSFDSGFLQELEKVLTVINDEIIKQQLSGLVDNVKYEDHFMYLKKKISGSELKKIRQEFTKICKMHPPKNKSSLIKSYIDYINNVQERF